MSALPVGQKSLTKAVSQWWRAWIRRGSARFELKCCGDEEVERTEPRTFQDLQRVCTMCNHHRRCRGDLACHADDPAWHDYCPNASTLTALNALPWRARSEW